MNSLEQLCSLNLQAGCLDPCAWRCRACEGLASELFAPERGEEGGESLRQLGSRRTERRALRTERSAWLRFVPRDATGLRQFRSSARASMTDDSRRTRQHVAWRSTNPSRRHESLDRRTSLSAPQKDFQKDRSFGRIGRISSSTTDVFLRGSSVSVASVFARVNAAKQSRATTLYISRLDEGRSNDDLPTTGGSSVLIPSIAKEAEEIWSPGKVPSGSMPRDKIDFILDWQSN